MAKDDDMRARLQLPTRADLTGFATKADLASFATKADLTAFAETITHTMGIMLDDAKDSVRKAVEGYGGTLERIERDLSEFRSEFRNKSPVYTFSGEAYSAHGSSIRKS